MNNTNTQNFIIDFTRTAPLAGAAWFVEFTSTYGSALLTALSIAYAAVNIYFRVKEHRAKMKEYRDGSE